MLTIVDFHNKKNFLDKLIIGLAQDRTRSQYSIVGRALGGFLKLKKADHLIQGTIFNLENDGSIDFSINRKTSVQESVKVLVFSRQEKLCSLTGNRTRVYRFEVWHSNHYTTKEA